jgi:hypothetical protein
MKNKNRPFWNLTSRSSRRNFSLSFLLARLWRPQAGIYGSQLEFTPYLIRGWDDSGDFGP